MRNIFNHSINLKKLPFLASLSLHFPTIYAHLFSKFIHKSAQSGSIFPGKLNHVKCLFLILTLVLTSSINGELVQNVNSDLNDFTFIPCTLRSFERRPHSAQTQLNRHVLIKGTASSLNWSGCVAFSGTSQAPNPTYQSVTKVSGCWTIPTLTANPAGDTFSSAWVGIDGYASPSVEQIGTEHDVINGVAQYYAWFELYPAPSQAIDGFPVSPGDLIEAKVVYKGKDCNGNDVFRLTIKNHTEKVIFSTHQHTTPGYPAHLSSAEWIMEAPAFSDPRIGCLNVALLPLADFGSVSFKKCKAVINGKAGPINNKHWAFDLIAMIGNDDVVKAVPSNLITKKCSPRTPKCNESRFQVTWANAGEFPYQSLCPPLNP